MPGTGRWVNRKLTLQVIATCLLVSACAATGPTGKASSSANDSPCTLDPVREAAIAEQALATLFDGTPVRIPVDMTSPGNTFQAVWLRGQAGKPTVVLTHGPAGNLASESLNEMAMAINANGYGALMLQLPVTRKQCEGSDTYPITFDSAVKRIDAAANWLRGRGLTDLALYGHWIGNVYFGRTSKAPYQYWVVNGLTGNFRSIADNPSLKILDLYGSNAIPVTRRTAWIRRLWLKMGKDGQQVVIDGAPHNFAGKYSEAAAAIDRFLQHQPATD